MMYFGYVPRMGWYYWNLGYLIVGKQKYMSPLTYYGDGMVSVKERCSL